MEELHLLIFVQNLSLVIDYQIIVIDYTKLFCEKDVTLHIWIWISTFKHTGNRLPIYCNRLHHFEIDWNVVNSVESFLKTKRNSHSRSHATHHSTVSVHHRATMRSTFLLFLKFVFILFLLGLIHCCCTLKYGDGEDSSYFKYELICCWRCLNFIF